MVEEGLSCSKLPGDLSQPRSLIAMQQRWHRGQGQEQGPGGVVVPSPGACGQLLDERPHTRTGRPLAPTAQMTESQQGVVVVILGVQFSPRLSPSPVQVVVGTWLAARRGASHGGVCSRAPPAEPCARAAQAAWMSELLGERQVVLQVLLQREKTRASRRRACEALEAQGSQCRFSPERVFCTQLEA